MASKSQNKYFMICPLNFILKYDLKKFINHIQTEILNRRLTETVINQRRFTHLIGKQRKLAQIYHCFCQCSDSLAFF